MSIHSYSMDRLPYLNIMREVHSSQYIGGTCGAGHTQIQLVWCRSHPDTAWCGAGHIQIQLGVVQVTPRYSWCGAGHIQIQLGVVQVTSRYSLVWCRSHPDTVGVVQVTSRYSLVWVQVTPRYSLVWVPSFLSVNEAKECTPAMVNNISQPPTRHVRSTPFRLCWTNIPAGMIHRAPRNEVLLYLQVNYCNSLIITKVIPID